jgi:mannose-6-phosphate isomerase-like protein (cupin superfamily)
MKTALLAASVLALTLPVLTLTAAGQTPAPHDAATVFPMAGLHTRLADLAQQAKAKGSSGATLEDYGTYKIQLSVRTTSGGAEVHAHWDDVMFVEEGTATLITGGTVPDGKTNADGETHGPKIEGGHSQLIKPGDVLTVRAGTPHQLILPPGTTYGSVVIKVHEP